MLHKILIEFIRCTTYDEIEYFADASIKGPISRGNLILNSMNFVSRRAHFHCTTTEHGDLVMH
jgi:hypothetical protein